MELFKLVGTAISVISTIKKIKDCGELIDEYGNGNGHVDLGDFTSFFGSN